MAGHIGASFGSRPRSAVARRVPGANLGDKQDVPPSLRFLFDNFSDEVIFVMKELCLADESLSAIPRVLRNFTLLQRLDISRNFFRTLPVQLMDEYMPKLKALDVSQNRLGDMQNVKQLGLLKEMRDLNLLGNPLLAVNQRCTLIAHLLFGCVRPTRARLETLLFPHSNRGRGEQQAPATEVKPSIIASESMSRMIISGLTVGQVLPTYAVQVLSSSQSAGASAVVYADLTRAPVPRPAGMPFRFLSELNLQPVTKEDLDQAARVCTLQSVDKVAAPKTQRKKLTGKAKQQELEQSLLNIELERRQRKIDHALKKLMRDGTFDEFQAGIAGAAHVYNDDSASDDNDDNDNADIAPTRLHHAPAYTHSHAHMCTAAEAATEAQNTLDEVGECRRHALSVTNSLWNRLDGAQQPSALSSSRGSPPTPHAHTTTAHTESAAASLESSAAIAPDILRAPKQSKGWTTCPPAWWERDCSKNGATRQAADLPTRLSVVQMGEEELLHSRRAVMGMYAVTRQAASTGTNTHAHAHDVKGALPAATEEEEIMRKNSKVEWDEVEEEQRDQEVRLQRQTARAANIRAVLHTHGAAAKRAKTSRALVGVSVGETLKFELPSQRDYDSTLLHRRMPNFFKGMNLQKFLNDEKDARDDLLPSSSSSAAAARPLKTAGEIGTELDALFTATNIQNKLEASATGAHDKRSLAWEQKKALTQAAQSAWENHLSVHQYRLGILINGGWPHPILGLPGDGPSEEQDRAKLAGKGPQRGGNGYGAGMRFHAHGVGEEVRCPVAKDLMKQVIYYVYM